MDVPKSDFSDVVLRKMSRFGDERGYFSELWHEMSYSDDGLPAVFRQDNMSYSTQGVLRGLHFQNPNGQGKLLSVLKGEVVDVIVDLRRGSPTFGQWERYTLSFENCLQLYVPPGFAHGFCVTGEDVLFHYKCSELYDPSSEHTLAWDDPDVGVEWPLENPTVSDKDQSGTRLKDFPEESLPVYTPEG